MQLSDLAAVDLNLLVAFDALMTHRSVTEAGRRLHLSQPAMSRALGRLRDLFGDQLLVRSGHRMLPTPLATHLAVPVRTALLEVRRVLHAEQAFDPVTARRPFVLSTSDHSALSGLPELRRKLAVEAPGIDIVQLPLRPDYPEALEAGVVDLVVGANEPERPGFAQQVLFEEDLVCVVSERTATVADELTLELYLSLPHALVSPAGEERGPVDHLLASRGLDRRIALRVTEFLAATWVVAQTDLILTVPRQVGVAAAEFLPLRVLPLPLPSPRIEVVMVWHQRFTNDPAHRWLRDAIVAVSNDGS